MFDCEEVGCTDNVNYFNYLYVPLNPPPSSRYIQYCESGDYGSLYGILWGVLIVLYIYLLCSTADKYFCTILEGFVEQLHIPPNIAGISMFLHFTLLGVTFLSFGNGVPDVFSLITSVLKDNEDIGVGSNIGGGFFVTTVVVGMTPLSLLMV